MEAARARFGTQLGPLTNLMSNYFFTAATIGVGGLMLLHWLALVLFELRGGGGGGDAEEEEEETDSGAAGAAATSSFADRDKPGGPRGRGDPSSVGDAAIAQAAQHADLTKGSPQQELARFRAVRHFRDLLECERCLVQLIQQSRGAQ